jgi:hypothetical protein
MATLTIAISAPMLFRRHILWQAEPLDLSAIECEQRAIDCLSDYETLSVEEKLKVLQETRELLRIAHSKRWREERELAGGGRER